MVPEIIPAGRWRVDKATQRIFCLHNEIFCANEEIRGLYSTKTELITRENIWKVLRNMERLKIRNGY
jgi:hypothetical protein